MKDKLIYIVAFVLTFLLVTGGIVYLNTIYKNIFAFDFTPTQTETETPAKEAGESDQTQEEQKPEEQDKVQEKPSEAETAIIINADSVKTALQNNPVDSTELKKSVKDSAKIKKEKSVALEDSIKHLKQQLKELASKKGADNDAKIDSAKLQYELANTISPKDSSYKSWIKKKLYHFMKQWTQGRLLK